MQTIYIIRGDTKNLKFKRINQNDKSVIKERPDKMYFTIKSNYEIEEFVFQKTLDDGINFDEESGYYYTTIEPEDTDNLPYSDFVYDIEVITGEGKKTIARGQLKIEEEVTFASNEG